MKRPGVDDFLARLAPLYEIIVSTPWGPRFADLVLDVLDPHRVCIRTHLSYIRHDVDLSTLGRHVSQTILVNDKEVSYHLANTIQCTSFDKDPEDKELEQIAAFLEGERTKYSIVFQCTKLYVQPQSPHKGP